MWNNFFKIIIVLLLLQFGAKAQEINSSVEVMYERVQNVDKKVFENLKNSLEEFINNRRWTSEMFQTNEKIQCNIFINILDPVGNIDENTYKANITITAARPVFNTDYTTPTFNFLDNDLTFKFDQAQVISFDDNRVSGSDALQSNLTAVVAYYIYMVLGMDFDSFSPLGGNPYFKKAQNIVNNAPEDTKLINGWKANEQNKRNRYWLVDQALNPRFEDLRVFWYTYHRQCLDQLSTNQENALSSIMPLIPKLKTINTENPSAILTQIIFNAKSSELANILSLMPQKDRQEAANILAQVDISNAAKYRNIR